MITKKLKFLEDGIVNGEVVFKAGEVYDIPVETGSFARWLKRGAIEVAEVAIPKVVAPVEAAPVEEEIKVKSKKHKKIESL